MPSLREVFTRYRLYAVLRALAAAQQLPFVDCVPRSSASLTISERRQAPRPIAQD